jgi:flavin-binding protein dodecin
VASASRCTHGGALAFYLPWEDRSGSSREEPVIGKSILIKGLIMSAKMEHAKAPAVVRVIELIGVSSESWSDAAREAVERASETVRHITGVDVLKSSAIVKDGKIVEYHVNLKVAFIVEEVDGYKE